MSTQVPSDAQARKVTVEQVRDIMSDAWAEVMSGESDRTVGDIMLEHARRVVDQVQMLRAPVQVPHPEGYAVLPIDEYDELKRRVQQLTRDNAALGEKVLNMSVDTIGPKVLPDGWEQLRGENMGEKCQISFIHEGLLYTAGGKTIDEAFRNARKKEIKGSSRGASSSPRS